MAAESEQPTPSEQPQPVERERSSERFGPLDLLRTRKADGRALLLFSRAREREDEGDPSPTPEQQGA
ncbi:MAG TPA: hypothetical protein VMB05_13110 [Solirubrobacteraceae bacterium]|nr:hypothetical protein [Solirubrobacteraceae bacterium]